MLRHDLSLSPVLQAINIITAGATQETDSNQGEMQEHSTESLLKISSNGTKLKVYCTYSFTTIITAFVKVTKTPSLYLLLDLSKFKMFRDDIYCQPELQHVFVEPEVSVCMLFCGSSNVPYII